MGLQRLPATTMRGWSRAVHRATRCRPVGPAAVPTPPADPLADPLAAASRHRSPPLPLSLSPLSALRISSSPSHSNRPQRRSVILGDSPSVIRPRLADGVSNAVPTAATSSAARGIAASMGCAASPLLLRGTIAGIPFPPNSSISIRPFHASIAARKTLLTTGAVLGLFQGSRALLTALPVLWRWNFFARYPRTMWFLAAIPGVAVFVVVVTSLDKHPITSRRRLMFIDELTELELSEQEEKSMLNAFSTSILPEKHPLYLMVKPVATNLIKVVGEDFRDWRLVVVDKPDIVNAMVLPNGTIFVFTGMLHHTQTLSELAGIIGHEISHVISRHGAESIGVEQVFTIIRDTFHSILYMFSVNLPLLTDISGATLDQAAPLIGSRPYSRMLETEADEIGIYMMAAAGYDPRVMVSFWERMSQSEESTDGVLFQLARTHPSSATRAEEIRTHLDQALKIYEANKRLHVQEDVGIPPLEGAPTPPTNWFGSLGARLWLWPSAAAQGTTTGAAVAEQAMERKERNVFELFAAGPDEKLWFATAEGRKRVLDAVAATHR